MQADNPAPGCAPEASGATNDRDLGFARRRSMPIAVASLCQSVSMLSALTLHSITDSLIHSLIHLLTPSCTAAARQAISPIFLLK